MITTLRDWLRVPDCARDVELIAGGVEDLPLRAERPRRHAVAGELLHHRLLLTVLKREAETVQKGPRLRVARAHGVHAQQHELHIAVGEALRAPLTGALPLI